MRSVDDIRTIGVVGCGLIGTGWIIQFLASGLNVVAFDAASDVE
ncbi:MAG: 3-hydroxyacyl-CoA dehydrogenase NAD-binding domain-containing protein, partial [Pseudomonadota bacterium]